MGKDGNKNRHIAAEGDDRTHQANFGALAHTHPIQDA